MAGGKWWENGLSLDFEVPTKYVSDLIGPGGAVIRPIRQETRTNIRFTGHVSKVNVSVCHVSGSHSNGWENIVLAKTRVLRQISFLTGNQFPAFEVQTKYVGRLIGAGGSNIRTLQGESGVRISFTAVAENKSISTCQISGSADHALLSTVKQRVLAQIADLAQNGEKVLEFTIPSKYAGSIIGPAGATARFIQQETNTKISVTDRFLKNLLQAEEDSEFPLHETQEPKKSKKSKKAEKSEKAGKSKKPKKPDQFKETANQIQEIPGPRESFARSIEEETALTGLSKLDTAWPSVSRWTGSEPDAEPIVTPVRPLKLTSYRDRVLVPSLQKIGKDDEAFPAGHRYDTAILINESAHKVYSWTTQGTGQETVMKFHFEQVDLSRLNGRKRANMKFIQTQTKATVMCSEISQHWNAWSTRCKIKGPSVEAVRLAKDLVQEIVSSILKFETLLSQSERKKFFRQNNTALLGSVRPLSVRPSVPGPLQLAFKCPNCAESFQSLAAYNSHLLNYFQCYKVLEIGTFLTTEGNASNTMPQSQAKKGTWIQPKGQGHGANVPELKAKKGTQIPPKDTLPKALKKGKSTSHVEPGTVLKELLVPIPVSQSAPIQKLLVDLKYVDQIIGPNRANLKAIEAETRTWIVFSDPVSRPCTKLETKLCTIRGSKLEGVLSAKKLLKEFSLALIELDQLLLGTKDPPNFFKGKSTAVLGYTAPHFLPTPSRLNKWGLGPAHTSPQCSSCSRIFKSIPAYNQHLLHELSCFRALRIGNFIKELRLAQWEDVSQSKRRSRVRPFGIRGVRGSGAVKKPAATPTPAHVEQNELEAYHCEMGPCSHLLFLSRAQLETHSKKVHPIQRSRMENVEPGLPFSLTCQFCCRGFRKQSSYFAHLRQSGPTGVFCEGKLVLGPQKRFVPVPGEPIVAEPIGWKAFETSTRNFYGTKLFLVRREPIPTPPQVQKRSRGKIPSKSKAQRRVRIIQDPTTSLALGAVTQKEEYLSVGRDRLVHRISLSSAGTNSAESWTLRVENLNFALFIGPSTKHRGPRD